MVFDEPRIPTAKLVQTRIGLAIIQLIGANVTAGLLGTARSRVPARSSKCTSTNVVARIELSTTIPITRTLRT